MTTANRRRSTRRKLRAVTCDNLPPPPSHLDDLDAANLRIVDALFHTAGLIAAEDPPPPTTPEELEDELAVAQFVRALLGRS